MDGSHDLTEGQMTYDVFFFDASTTTAPARVVYEAFLEEDPSLAGRSPRVAAFAARALADPEIEDVEYDEGSDQPGGGGFWVGLPFSGKWALHDRLVALARECGLSAYDPQLDEMVSSERPGPAGH